MLLALAWAVYLVPKALKHHDEVSRARSVDRFSGAMRVLARREPVDRRNGRLVVTPARSQERVVAPPRRAGEAGKAPAPSPEARRRAAAARGAARAAARRRRRVTLVLLVADLAVVGLAAFAILPWWSVAIPVALTFSYLVLCRRQVAREDEVLWTPSADRSGPSRPAARVDSAYGSAQSPYESLAAPDLERASDEDTMAIPVVAQDTVPVFAETVDGGSLWDPLPVTLPTYVNKARASRSVRTIDLGSPGAWTSGRDEADSALVEQSGAAETGDAALPHEERRAVGS